MTDMTPPFDRCGASVNSPRFTMLRHMSIEIAEFWDNQAASFDESPDHGLLDPGVRETWSRLILPLMPEMPAVVADLGCGTGSLSVLLAERGFDVRGFDLAPRMVEAARVKAQNAGVSASFEVGDAATPNLEDKSVDVILVRHVLWAIPDPRAAIVNWDRLLKPNGRMILIEGHWWTGGGLTAAQTSEIVLQVREEARVRTLEDPALWGKEIGDERYLIFSGR